MSIKLGFTPLVYAVLTAILLQSCIEAETTYSGIPPGPWRGVLKLVQVPISSNPKGEPLPEKLNMQFEEVTAGELPFNFEVKYARPDSFYLILQNGKERIILNDIAFGRDPATGKDTFLIHFPVYQAYLRGAFSENVLEGEWVDLTREDYRIPFLARHGKSHRFTTLQKKPIQDISGQWEVDFAPGTDDTYKAIGEFTQSGNHLEGTFQTETGDFRYLEGTVQGNKVYLSAFDGAHAYLFEAKINPDSTIIGGFRSGYNYQCTWEAKRNPTFTLRDPHEITLLKPGMQSISFRFPNAKGEQISLEDPTYQNKVKVIQIMGTWCPNCRDESDFFVHYLRNHPNTDLEVIALAFERITDTNKALEGLHRYSDQMKLPYQVLLAGSADKAEASKALPIFTKIVAFPTLVLVDRKNRIRKIHTGFAGPATSGYAAFQEDFHRSVTQLLEEK